jgi:hypothetical protein
MRTSETTKELYKAIFQARKQFNDIHKKSKNPHFKSNYADLNTILADIEPSMEEAGLLLIQGSDGNVNSIITRLVHSESGEYVEIEMSAPLEKQNAQGVGSLQSYLRRYSLMALFCLRAEDDDAQVASQPVQKQNNQPVPNMNTPEQQSQYDANKKAVIEEIKQLREYAKLSPEQATAVVGSKYSARMTLDELTVVKETLTDFVERMTTNRLTPEDHAILLEGKVA